MKEFEEFVFKRCEYALSNNSEYINHERNEDICQYELQKLAGMLCYENGAKDACSVIFDGDINVEISWSLILNELTSYISLVSSCCHNPDDIQDKVETEFYKRGFSFAIKCSQKV